MEGKVAGRTVCVGSMSSSICPPASESRTASRTAHPSERGEMEASGEGQHDGTSSGRHRRSAGSRRGKLTSLPVKVCNEAIGGSAQSLTSGSRGSVRERTRRTLILICMVVGESQWVAGVVQGSEERREAA